MCNACGFLCCGYDGFARCGCDGCPCPECWDEDDNDFTCDSDDDWATTTKSQPSSTRTPPMGESKRSPIWLEYSVGAHFVWVVWAVKPGAVRLIAICSDEEKADRYAAHLPPGLSDFKAWKERAPIDHSFGFADSLHARVQGKL